MEENSGIERATSSRVGKQVTLKAVVQAIPTNMMNIFQIPEGILKNIHSMMAQFCWGFSNGNHKTY